MAAVRSLVNDFFSLFLLIFLHLGCFCFFSSPPSNTDQPPTKRRKISPISQQQQQQPLQASSTPSHSTLPKPQRGSSSLSISVRSYLKHLFSAASFPFHRPNPHQSHHSPAIPPLSVSPTALPQQQPRPNEELVSPDLNAPNIIPSSGPHLKPDISAGDTTVIRPSFAARANIFPCPACGEVFNKAHLLDLHQATKHALSELSDGDSGKNIVRIIFQSGWKGKAKGTLKGDDVKIPAVHRILKIHNSPKTLARFEEYREAVRMRAAASRSSGGRLVGNERCVADGNEQLRFYCATFLCGLGREGNLGTCGSQFCSTCGIVRHGFSGKDPDGIVTNATGWGAHASLPEELEREFAFMQVRRAILVCRVVAGRVAFGKGRGSAAAVGGEDDGVYDSVVAVGRGGGGGLGDRSGEDELLVFNPRAVLPCFVIIYTV